VPTIAAAAKDGGHGAKSAFAHPTFFTVIARSEATKQSSLACGFLDCFAEPVIGRRFAPTRWLAMTEL
jgi:hypothetical protein